MDIVTKEILDQVEGMDFGCDFKEGTCIGVKRRNKKLKPLNQICCRSCYHYTGYLRIKKENLPEKYKKYFSIPKGFLGENGCKLPIEMRSRRCVIYTCRDSNISDKNRKILVKLERTT